MATYEIENLEQVLAPFLDESHIVSTEFSKLTSAGDNYGGALVNVEVTTGDGKNQKLLRLVAKLLPQNEMIQRLFNSQRTFRNEVGFYQIIVPCLRNFQKEQGVKEILNATPDFYGARFSLDPSSTKVDINAVLLIKNLKDEGFTIVDRKVGFDLEQTKMVLVKLAEIHATGFALKVLKPDTFEQQIGPFIQKFGMFEENNATYEDLVNSLLNLVKSDELCIKNWTKIKDAMMANGAEVCKKNKDCDHRFLGLVHSDLWTNNILVKFENSEMVDVNFIDFQLYEYTSLARDIVFFLFTSVQLQILKEQYDNLILYYYESFINFLMKLHCDTSDLSFERFLSELDSAGKQGEFLHIMLMLRPIYLSDEKAKEVEEIEINDFFFSQASKTCTEKACYIVHEFIKRGWI